MMSSTILESSSTTYLHFSMAEYTSRFQATPPSIKILPSMLIEGKIKGTELVATSPLTKVSLPEFSSKETIDPEFASTLLK